MRILLDEYRISPDFEPLHAENCALRAELAAMHEEREYITRYLMPSTRTAWLIQVGALRAELLRAQTDVRRIRRRMALMREAAGGADDEAIEDALAAEFREWDERIRFEQGEIESAKQRFSSLTRGEDFEEIRAVYRMLARKLNPEINPGQSDEAKSFWPSVQAAYEWNDLFQLKALLMMAEDYPETYDLPSDMGSVRRANADLKEMAERARADLAVMRQNPAFEWRRLLDDPSALAAEQARLREEIAKARIQRTALEDMLRSMEMMRRGPGRAGHGV